MSVHAVKWAWEQAVANPTQKLVLIALADHANSDGVCWPSMGTVAQLANCSPRTARRHVDELCAAGIVQKATRRRRADGTLSTWEYRLSMASGQPQPEAVSGQRPSTASGHRGSQPAATGGHHQRPPVTAQNQAFEPTPEPSGRRAARLDDVDGMPLTPAEGLTFAQTLGRWVIEQGVTLPAKDRKAERYAAVLDCVVGHVPDEHPRRRGVVIAFIADYVADVTGEVVDGDTRGHLARLVGEFDAQAVMHAAGEAVGWGAGIGAEHADDPKAFTKYMARILYGERQAS